MPRQNDANCTQDDHGPKENGRNEFSPIFIRQPQSLDLNQLVQQYIKDGVNIGPSTQGITSLREAVLREDLNSVRLLLSAGASPYFVDDAGDTPLLLAIRSGKVELVQLLVDAGADVNYVNPKSHRPCPKSALHEAVDAGHDILKLLLDCGADPNRANNFGMSVLFKVIATIKNKNNSKLRLLLEHGADMYDGGLQNPVSPFEQLVSLGQVEALKIFFDHGFDPRKYVSSQVYCPTPLHHAVRCDGPHADDTLSLIINHYKSDDSLDLECVNEQGLTPLGMAVVTRRLETVKLLIQAGADLNHADIKGRTPLEFSFGADRNPCLPLLVEAGARLGNLIEGLISLSQGFNLLLHESDTDVDDDESDFHGDSDDQVGRDDSDSDVEFVQLPRRGEIRGEILEKIDVVVKYRVLFESKSSVDDPILEKMHNAETLRSYYESCTAEIDRLKNCFFYRSVTYYSVLTDEDFRKRVRYDRAYEAFNSDNLMKEFPIYHSDLFARFQRGKDEHELWKSALIALRRLLGIEINSYHLIFFNILNFLSKKDLRRLSSI